MKRVVSLVLVVGCGDVSSTKKPDAAVADMAKQVDAMADAAPPPCDVTAQFGTPTPLGGVNTNSGDVWGWLTPDELTIYFSSNATGSSNRDLYVATRAQPSGSFSGVMLLPGNLNSTGSQEERPIATADGLSLYYETNGGGDVDVYVATRSNTAQNFSGPGAVAVVSDATANDMNPFITGDGLIMYFVSDRDGDFDIFRATRASTTMNFGTPTAVGELNHATQNDYSPVLSNDGLEIFFASFRSGNSNNDIFRATRSTVNDGFGTPSLVTELTVTGADEFPTWISADRCTLMFTSSRSGGSGGQDIWVATRPQ